MAQKDLEPILSEIRDATKETLSMTTRVVELLEQKVDTLIECVSGKDRIPLNVFGWVVGGLILFIFVREIGVSGIKDLGRSLTEIAQAVTQAEDETYAGVPVAK